MLEICDFLSGKAIHLGFIENKNNIKNDRYQTIGGSCIFSFGKIVVDAHIYLKSQVSTDLILPEDFASDLLVQKLTLCSTIKILDDAISDGRTIGNIEDTVGLGCTIFFTRLHMHAVNVITAPPKQRGIYLWTSMIWFTLLYGLNITPKRNLVSETIANGFLVLRSDFCKFRY